MPEDLDQPDAFKACSCHQASQCMACMQVHYNDYLAAILRCICGDADFAACADCREAAQGVDSLQPVCQVPHLSITVLMTSGKVGVVQCCNAFASRLYAIVSMTFKRSSVLQCIRK